MIPILYESTETSFTSNGICRLTDCISCEVTEERNGIFECEFQYPVTGVRFSEIKEGRIIYATHCDDDEPQPFDIYKHTAPIDGIVTFYAHHISYRLNNIILNPFTANNLTNTLIGLKNNTITTNPFNFGTSKSVTATFKVDYPTSVRSVLGGTEGSLLDVFGGGEYEFDHFSVRLWANRGNYHNVTIRYGKNLTDINDEIDVSSTYNAVVPYYYTEDAGLVTLPEKVIVYGGNSEVSWTDENGVEITDESNHVISFADTSIKMVALNLTDAFSEPPTEEELRTAAQSRFENSRAWVPHESIDIDFAQLWQFEEYEDYAAWQKLKLCDTAEIIYEDIGVDVRAKVIKTVYNTLLDRYSSMTFGEPKSTFAQVMQAQTTTALTKTETQLYSALQYQTDLITGGLGGNVVINTDSNGRPNEILIMDNIDKDIATNVLRMNQNGIGFSTSGYNGPFQTAWTIDGSFSANFIKSGVIEAQNNHMSINLNDGQIISNENNLQTMLDDGVLEFYYYQGGSTWSQCAKVLLLPALLNSLRGLGIYGTYVSIGTIYTGSTPDTEKLYINDLKTSLTNATTNIFNNNTYFYPVDATGSSSDRNLAVNMSTSGKARLVANNAPLDFVRGSTTIMALDNGTYYASGTLNLKQHMHVDAGKTIIFHTANDNPSISAGVLATVYTKFCITDAYIGLGTNTPTRPYIVTVGGGLYVDESVSCQSLAQRSDERLKNIYAWDERYDQLLDKLEPILFTWKDSDDPHLGLSAQKVQKALEELNLDGIVTEDEYLSINYTELTMLLINRVKDQKEQIKTLEDRIAELERKVEMLCRSMN